MQPTSSFKHPLLLKFQKYLFLSIFMLFFTTTACKGHVLGPILRNQPATLQIKINHQDSHNIANPNRSGASSLHSPPADTTIPIYQTLRLHPEVISFYRPPDLNSQLMLPTTSNGQGLCPWGLFFTSLQTMKNDLPNFWIRWDQETGHATDTTNNVETFLQCTQQANVPMIIAASAVDGYNNWWAENYPNFTKPPFKQVKYSILDIGNGPYIGFAVNLLKKYNNISFLETINEPDIKITNNNIDYPLFVSDYNNAQHYDTYMLNLLKAINNDKNQLLGPATAFTSGPIWSQHSTYHIPNLSYHNYQGWQGLLGSEEDTYVTEYGTATTESLNCFNYPYDLLSDLLQGEINGKLSHNIKKIFYCSLDTAWDLNHNEENHFGFSGWLRGLEAYQYISNIANQYQSDTYISPNNLNSIHTSSSNNHFAALLWSSSGNMQKEQSYWLGNSKLTDSPDVYVATISDSTYSAVQCTPLASQSDIQVQFYLGSIFVSWKNLPNHGAVFISSENCNSLFK